MCEGCCGVHETRVEANAFEDVLLWVLLSQDTSDACEDLQAQLRTAHAHKQQLAQDLEGAQKATGDWQATQQELQETKVGARN